MNERGKLSDKQKLIQELEQAYLSANSEQNFYKKLQQKGLELYQRNKQIVGVKLKRKYRFKTLGYQLELLKELNKNLTKNKRLERIERIRKHQREQEKNKDKKR